MKNIVFFTGSYGRNSAEYIAIILRKFEFTVLVTNKKENVLKGADIVIIDECSSQDGRNLYEFLKENPVIPFILCGCDGCKDKEFIWGDDDRKIFVKILAEFGEEKMAKFFSK